MLELIDLEMGLLFLLCLILSVAGYSLLYFSQTTSNSFLRKILFVPARKSKTNALQLGGLPLSLSVVISLTCYLFIFKDDNYFPPIDRSVLKCWLVSALGIITYGYLDDRYEFRPVVKLVSQVLCMFIFSFFSSMLFLAVDSRLSFIISFMASLAVINGTNLLDGLDTLTVKNSLAIYFTYFIFGAVFHSYPIVMLSLIMMIPVGIFWFYNKEPSKIHMGEIGGTFIGFSFVLLSSLTYKWIGYNASNVDSFSYAIIPLTLPVVEVVVSSLRRLYNNRSMLKGDQMHIHHILNKYKKYSHSKSSWFIGGTNFVTMAIGSTIAYFIYPPLGAASVVIMQVTIMVAVGKEYWGGDNVMKLTPRSIFGSLRKKDITVIQTSNVENFKLTIINQDNESSEKDIELPKKAS